MATAGASFREAARLYLSYLESVEGATALPHLLPRAEGPPICRRFAESG